MSGMIFFVCIPIEKFENTLKETEGLESQKATNSKRFYGDSSKYCQRSSLEQLSMEKILRSLLEEFIISNATWCKGEQYAQVIFSLDCSDRCEKILECLRENEIGHRYNSVVSVVPCTVQYNALQKYKLLEEEEEGNTNEDSHEKHNAWHRFLSTIRARLTVAQVVENVKTQAVLTFDFLLLIFISATLCAIGLVEDSMVWLLSGMVMCPMMGPVTASTFGAVIKHKRLLKTGIQNELLGLGIATVVGFCYGSIICVTTDYWGRSLPTPQMLSQGQLHYLWVGSLTAVLSGAVVALGILSDNIASLVGVAISISLTPPAVNAGLLWSFASIYYFKGGDVKCHNLTLNYYYSNDCISEMLSLGAVSMCLTFSNILCIYGAGILVFKIKEVAPISSKDCPRRRFWKHDIKVARDYINSDARAPCMITKLSEEINQYQKSRNHNLNHSLDLNKDHTKVNFKRSEFTWSPCTHFSDYLYINEIKKTKSNSPRDTRARRLSQLFDRDDSKLEPIIERHEGSHNTISDLSNASERSSGNKQSVSGKKKFVVTPCQPDALNP